MKGRVLIVAGSDSGGGAGIQADIKTVTMLGGYAATAVTALTVQNTLGVTGVHPVPPAFVQAQMRAVLDDIGVDVIKTGMLGDEATIRAVEEAIPHSGELLVVDPVMVAKGGARLLPAGAESALWSLFGSAHLITPNTPELETLVGQTISREAEALQAGRELSAATGSAVLVKGGHLEGEEVVDWLLIDAEEHRFASPRIATRHTHGTGCTLASAIACGLAKGLPLVEAVRAGRDYVQGAIRAAPGFGQGHGPLGHSYVLTEAQRHPTA